MSVKVTHSLPTWVVGPHKPHHKFGGPATGGFASVEKRLLAIKRHFPGDLTSLHLGHELMSSCADVNGPDAIDWSGLVDGLSQGRFPQVCALTAPGFGWERVHYGAILSPFPDVRDTVRRCHIEAIERALWLKEHGFGRGYVIWWPAFDGQVRGRGLKREEAWARLRKFWTEVLRETGGVVHLEYKPAVPADMDYINTVHLAIAFCLQVNDALGRRAMVLNNEWAHFLIGGMPVEDGTRLTNEAGLFAGLVHVNSAELADVHYDMLTGELICGAPSDDKDWPVGYGYGTNAGGRWSDQAAAVWRLFEHAETNGITEIVFEHDLDPLGEDPFEYYAESRRNLETMIEESWEA